MLRLRLVALSGALALTACAAILGLDDFEDGDSLPTSSASSSSSGGAGSTGSAGEDGGGANAYGGRNATGGAGGSPATGGAGGDGAGGAPLTMMKRVFATEEEFTGDFLGGAFTANNYCEAALGLSLGSGGWVAWVSTDNQSVFTLIPANGGPWFLIDPQTGEADPTAGVATSKTALLDGSIAHAIDRDEEGDPISGSTRVWTGTNDDGNATDETCSNWTEGLGGSTGRVGNVGMNDINWTTQGNDLCNTTNTGHLYCFEL